ncbi:hypothetical protein FHS90_004628 [Rufibacter quisquiliarum]|uniref:Uncharacterized protein n=1 Tax=Rufibacter quisquiliarum TaxID=1549639 RepID=A0A839GYI6_9BACT|nr:hypothetical protein [Rufibacter quisquiliarum]
MNDDLKFDFYPLFLNLFYSSNSYDDCCLGKASSFYTFNTSSRLEFTKEFENKQKEFRDFLKNNGKRIQTIKKDFQNGFKEKVTIYATPFTAKLCHCEASDDRHFLSVYLPFTDFKPNSTFWNTGLSSKLYTDYSQMNPKY